MGLRVLQQGEDFLLDGNFVSVRQFISIAREDLDAIVSPRIMRRRNDHAGGIFARARQVGDAGVVITPALWTQFRWQLVHGSPDLRSMNSTSACPARSPPEPVRYFVSDRGRSAPDHVGAVLGQGEFAGDAANPIGAEELSRLGCHAWTVRLKTAQRPPAPAPAFSIITVTRTGFEFITCTRDQKHKHAAQTWPVHGSLASTESVIAASTASTRFCGPLIVTVEGSAMMRRWHSPEQNCPPPGMHRNLAREPRVKREVELAGNDLHDLQLSWLTIWSVVRSNVRSPGFIPLSSMSAETSAACRRRTTRCDRAPESGPAEYSPS